MDGKTNGFMLSSALHVLVAGALFLAYFIADQAANKAPKVLELVAGEGDNYMATEAPALGIPGGIKVPLPDIPATKPMPPDATPAQLPPEPVVPKVPVEKSPVEKAPKTDKATVTKEEPIRDFAKDVRRIQNKRATKLIEKARKEREAEERKAKEAELKSKRMTKEEFDRQNRREAAAKQRGGGSVKVAKIDAEGIAKGVIGGSSANKTGGGGGTALTREEGDVFDGYVSLLARKIKDALDEQPGVGAGLQVEVEIRILSDGTIKGFRITRSSGSTEFDQVVREAFANMSLPPRPKGMSELQRFPIRGVD